MRFMPPNRNERQKRIEQREADLWKQRDRLQVLLHERDSFFTEAGDIRPIGLAWELSELDKTRRTCAEIRPDDSVAQALIQGQQNEAMKLQGWKDRLDANILALQSELAAEDAKLMDEKRKVSQQR